MARNWNNIWRYIHLSLGIVLVIYHARIAWYHNGFVDSVWSAGVDKFISTIFIFFVMWSGLAKWPIYPWYKKRQNRKKARGKGRTCKLMLFNQCTNGQRKENTSAKTMWRSEQPLEQDVSFV